MHFGLGVPQGVGCCDEFLDYSSRDRFLLLGLGVVLFTNSPLFCNVCTVRTVQGCAELGEHWQTAPTTMSWLDICESSLI